MGKKTLVFLVLLILALVPMQAATINFMSGDGIGELAGVVVINNVPSVWDQSGPGKWVSFWQSGEGGYSPPNTTPGGPPTAVFSETFFLPGSINTGWITFWADDTGDGWLYNAKNPAGLLLWTGPSAQGVNCVVGQPGCRAGTGLTTTLTNDQLAQGWNEIRMPTYQYFGSDFGEKHNGSIESVPEPATYALLGGGLVFLGFAGRRRITKSWLGAAACAITGVGFALVLGWHP